MKFPDMNTIACEGSKECPYREHEECLKNGVVLVPAAGRWICGECFLKYQEAKNIKAQELAKEVFD